MTDVLTKVYDHCRFLFEHNHTIKKKDLLEVEMCLKSLLKNKTLREFFNLALHMGCKSVVSDILDECTTEIMETKEREEQEKERATNPPSKGENLYSTENYKLLSFHISCGQEIPKF